MKKEVFYVFAWNDGKMEAVKKEGTRINIDGTTFMYHKEGRLFIVTDENSGMKLCEANTLKEAKKEAKRLLPAFYNLVKKDRYKKNVEHFQALRYEKTVTYNFCGLH